MAQWTALREKAEADLYDTSGTSFACFDVGTPLATFSINQTLSKRPPDTPPDTTENEVPQVSCKSASAFSPSALQ